MKGGVKEGIGSVLELDAPDGGLVIVGIGEAIAYLSV